MPSATDWSGSSGSLGSCAALDDAVAMRRAGPGLLSLALMASRNLLLVLLARDESALALRTALQAAAFQEYWLARHVQRGRGEACDPGAPRLAGIEPLLEAWLAPAGPLPTAEAVRGCLAATLEITLDLLAALPEDADDAALHYYRCSLLHEDRLTESLFETLREGGAGARATRPPLWLPAQRWMLGTAPGADANRQGLVPHNERWAHELPVPEFEIDAQVVRWAQYVEFAADGGYDRRDLWSDAGWAWVQAEGRRAPGGVEQLHGGVLVQQGSGATSRLLRASPAQPAVHVNRHEAEAWCCWAGRRLPTEPEWELAACQGAGRGFAWGEVFEWTAGSARAWPGAGRPAPGALDAIPAADAGLGVLRGASWATRRRWHHPKARRFADPASDSAFCGFRSCAA